MNSQISVPIQTEQFLQLVEFLRSNKDRRDPLDVISLAIDYWIDNASWKPELLSKNSTHGYQWKSLFLPAGTQIRMLYKGRYFYANVEGDEIIYEEKAVSPSSLANTIASSSRNAWRDLWIKRPGDSEWVLSDDCRNNISKVDTDKLFSELDAETSGPRQTAK